MKGTRFTDDQIIKVLKEAAAGIKPADLCRKYGVSEWTFYRWKSKYAGMEITDLKRMKGLEDENRRLKHMVADLSLDNQVLKELLSKTF